MQIRALNVEILPLLAFESGDSGRGVLLGRGTKGLGGTEAPWRNGGSQVGGARMRSWG